MNILNAEYSSTVRITISVNDSMCEVVNSFIEEGWEFHSHARADHPIHGKITYLLFSKNKEFDTTDEEI